MNKKLEEIRDNLAESNAVATAERKRYSAPRTDFMTGFKAAVKEFLPAIEALKFYETGEFVVHPECYCTKPGVRSKDIDYPHECSYDPDDFWSEGGEKAREALIQIGELPPSPEGG